MMLPDCEAVVHVKQRHNPWLGHFLDEIEREAGARLADDGLSGFDLFGLNVRYPA